MAEPAIFAVVEGRFCSSIAFLRACQEILNNAQATTGLLDQFRVISADLASLVSALNRSKGGHARCATSYGRCSDAATRRATEDTFQADETAISLCHDSAAGLKRIFESCCLDRPSTVGIYSAAFWTALSGEVANIEALVKIIGDCLQVSQENVDKLSSTMEIQLFKEHGRTLEEICESFLDR